MIPSAQKHLETFKVLDNTASLFYAEMEKARQGLSAIRAERELAYDTYFKEANAYLASLNLEVTYEVVEHIQHIKPDNPPTDYIFHVFLNGEVASSTRFDGLYDPVLRLKTLADFLNTDKTIHTMQCVKSLEEMLEGKVATMIHKI